LHAENPADDEALPVPTELPGNIQSLLEKHRILTTTAITTATVTTKSKDR
jgi:hypothetical protein